VAMELKISLSKQREMAPLSHIPPPTILKRLEGLVKNSNMAEIVVTVCVRLCCGNWVFSV